MNLDRAHIELTRAFEELGTMRNTIATWVATNHAMDARHDKTLRESM